MVNPLLVNLPVLMQVNRSEGGTLLPWPNGSLLSGKLMQPTASGAMLMLGNYRVRVEVPPNTPMGHIWLQLMQREMPGQFRLLTDKQAAALIAEMLKNTQAKIEHAKPNTHDKQSSKNQSGQQEWAKLPADTLPFGIEAYGDRLMLLSHEDGYTQGLLQKEEGKDGFILSGRLDLKRLGGIVFSLEGKKNQWKVNIHLANQSFKFEVEEKFAAWLSQQKIKNTAKLEGMVLDTIPESFGRSSNREA